LGKSKKKVKKKMKKKRIRRKNKNPLWEIKDGKVVRTNRECPRCGPGVFMAQHYNRISCGKCGYTKFQVTKAKSKTSATPTVKTIGGVAIKPRTRKRVTKP